MIRIGAFLLLAFSLMLSVAPRAEAAESYDNCTGFITSIPAVISTQGTWCLKQDLATAVTVGHAIDIQTNNVTIDCNNFKLGGLAAGSGTTAEGIYAFNRANATVRRCNIRGFAIGLDFDQGSGFLVENNRLDGNTQIGVLVQGENSIVQHNLVLDTGGTSVLANGMYGIAVNYTVDVLDNTVSGVVASSGSGNSAAGIWIAYDDGSSVKGNRIRNVLKDGAGVARGIYYFVGGNGRITISDNDVVGDGGTGSIGLDCTSNFDVRAKGNTINGFSTGISDCHDDGGNVVAP